VPQQKHPNLVNDALVRLEYLIDRAQPSELSINEEDNVDNELTLSLSVLQDPLSCDA